MEEQNKKACENRPKEGNRLRIAEFKRTVFLENSIDNITKFARNRSDTSAVMFTFG